MVRPAKTLLTVLLLAGVCLGASSTGAASQKPRSGRAKAAKSKVPPPAPAPPVPAPPPTPAQLPPNPPQVSFRDGLLTVSAQNSTLADILAAVRAQTGATIDLPPGSGSERVFFRQGPGAARDVLTALLKGSHFDFIILDSQQRPGDIERVLLLLKPAGSASSVAGGQPPAPAQSVVVNPNPDLDESNEEGVVDENESMQPPPQPEPVQPTPGPQPQTPEQLLEELRQQQIRQQQQMQQQQQQQQQNPPPQPPNSDPQ